MAGVAGAESGRNKVLDRLPDQILLGVTEQLCRARVCATNHPLAP